MLSRPSRLFFVVFVLNSNSSLTAGAHESELAIHATAPIVLAHAESEEEDEHAGHAPHLPHGPLEAIGLVGTLAWDIVKSNRPVVHRELPTAHAIPKDPERSMAKDVTSRTCRCFRST